LIINIVNQSNNNDLEKIVSSAFSEWEKNLNNIQFKNVKNNKDADIEIKLENKGVEQIGGDAIIYFDKKGFIDNV
jgi:hypothetical protein